MRPDRVDFFSCSFFFKDLTRCFRLSPRTACWLVASRFSNMQSVDCCLFVGCLTSQQHASVSQGRICSDNFTCCHTQIEVADQTFYLTQSQYTDTGPTSPGADPITPGAWQGSHWSANFEVTGMTRPRKNPVASGIRTRDLPLSRRTPEPLGQRGQSVDLLRQSYMLPHRDRSCKSKLALASTHSIIIIIIIMSVFLERFSM